MTFSCQGCDAGQCYSSPKVFAFTGPTGVGTPTILFRHALQQVHRLQVGKTETASKLVESFLAKRSKVGNGYAQRPQSNEYPQ